MQEETVDNIHTVFKTSMKFQSLPPLYTSFNQECDMPSLTITNNQSSCEPTVVM